MRIRTRAVWGSVALVAALFATACSSGSSTSSNTDTEDSTQTVNSEELTAARAIVEEAEQAISTFTAPGPEIDATGLEGKTVYYIVPVLEAAIFAAVKEHLDEAFGSLGIKVEQCGTNGGSPEGSANCLNQAVDAGADAIITTAIPSLIAPTAFQRVVDEGIPLLHLLSTQTGPGDPLQEAYLTPGMIKINQWLTNWVIADSNGQANVLATRITDNPVQMAWTDEGILGVFAEGCADCKANTIDVSPANADKVATDVTAFFISNPETNYLQMATDIVAAPAISGLQATQKAPSEIKVATLDGSLATMTAISQGQWYTAQGGWDPRALAWYSTDQVARMMVGQPAVQDLDFPFQRLFTEKNVGELTLTPEAYKSGEWYGEANFVDGFKELWGVN